VQKATAFTRAQTPLSLALPRSTVCSKAGRSANMNIATVHSYCNDAPALLTQRRSGAHAEQQLLRKTAGRLGCRSGSAADPAVMLLLLPPLGYRVTAGRRARQLTVEVEGGGLRHGVIRAGKLVARWSRLVLVRHHQHRANNDRGGDGRHQCASRVESTARRPGWLHHSNRHGSSVRCHSLP